MKAEACARDLASTLGITAETATAERAVRESQLVITTTPSREPVLLADWLHPRLHITAMGSDQAGKNEIEPKAVARADLYVCDRISQAEKLGELRAARAAGVLTTTGTAGARRNHRQDKTWPPHTRRHYDL